MIDISGNGRNNDGREVAEARDAAVAAGIRINGLPIVREEPGLAEYYARNLPFSSHFVPVFWARAMRG